MYSLTYFDFLLGDAVTLARRQNGNEDVQIAVKHDVLQHLALRGDHAGVEVMQVQMAEALDDPIECL